ncbi:DUF1800 domain-containing protein [Mucilaginibacter sp. PAMB04274]|uniref:DUF1800 domain-containing protein n=1 Tax=Mucilaginibacter sp. PAMB04274 TaxID=3138568 RepID=UPI0031F702B1
MKIRIQQLLYVVAILFMVTGLCAFYSIAHAYKATVKFPYKQAGLTERQAAAHLLSRFTYGATPGQVDEVIKIGLENWFAQQLEAKKSDDSLAQLLNRLDAENMSNAQLVAKYPRNGQLVRMAIRDGVVNKDSVKTDKKEYRTVLLNYMQQKGMAPEQELFRQFINQKVLRAAYTQNQLQEVMTDFWFNHFNVSITKNQCAVFIPAYERDVIRPNVFGKFGTMLLSTAKAPAMLVYLDNFTSVGENAGGAKPVAALKRKRLAAMMQSNQGDSMMTNAPMVKKLPKAKRAQGLNENYAREVMELHTLGVDGGYSQQDVTQAARVLTGWTVYPMGDEAYGGGVKKVLERLSPEQLDKQGFVHEGDFLFIPNRHDKGEKTVLGKKFGPNGGYQEGVDLLNMLAHHQSTAKFISRKLAVRFVSDAPVQSLVDKMARTFKEKDGDIKEVLLTLVSSPEFWSASALREKTKSPFELAVGAVRSLHAEIRQPYQLYSWVNKMGEKKYYYQAPTGFPDKGQYWINTGALLNRMNFGLALASGRIPGVKVDLASLNNHREPESAQDALATYSKLIMPERNLSETIKRLTPLLNDPQLMTKVEVASAQAKPAGNSAMLPDDPMMGGSEPAMKGKGLKGKGRNAYTAVQTANGNNSMLAQVVGVIIGSPEFQRR